MDPEQARKFLSLVNNIEFMSLLNEYCAYRIEGRHKELEDCEIDKVKGHQGAIKELKRFGTLRAEVLEKAK